MRTGDAANCGRRWLAIAALLLIVALTPMAAHAQASECNERCLKSILHRYLALLPTHDPSKLPLGSDLEARENSEPVRLGEGSWQSITAVLPGYEYADPEMGNVVYGGGVRRGRALGILFLRLKILDGHIIESEMLTSGPGAILAPGSQPPGAAPQTSPLRAPDLSGLMFPDILYAAPVPTNRRSTRALLARVPFQYMEGLTRADGSIPPFGLRCDRWDVDGRKVTNNPVNPNGAVTCATALDAMKRLQGRRIVNRRVVAVDVPLGIAVGMFIISYDIDGLQATRNVAEIFKVVDGRIRSIEEFNVPGRTPPGSGFTGQ
jgi:hypothetical protein